MRKWILIGLMCIALLTFTGCGADKSQVESTEVENTGEGMVVGVEGTILAVENVVTDYGNVAGEAKGNGTEKQTPEILCGNIINGGIVCETEEWLYYYNKSDNNSLYRINTDGIKEKVGKVTGAMDINVLEDGIVYLSNGICRYDFDTEKIEKIVEGTCRNVIVYDDKIYYLQSDNDIYRMHRINMDGSEDTLLSESISSHMNVYKDKIYYINGNDEARIHSMNIDGSEDAAVTKFGGVEEIVVENGMIYYVSNTSSGNKLWKIGVNGEGDSEVYPHACRSINIKNGIIYFSEKDGKFLCSIKTNGTGYTKIADCANSNINITSEWIYYFDADDINYYRIKKDGSVKELVE